MNNFVCFGRWFNQHLLIASWHETSKAGRCYGPSVTEWMFQGSDSSSSIPFSDVASSFAQGKRWVIGMRRNMRIGCTKYGNTLLWANGFKRWCIGDNLLNKRCFMVYHLLNKRCCMVYNLLRMLKVKRWFIVANLLNCGKLRDNV